MLANNSNWDFVATLETKATNLEIVDFNSNSLSDLDAGFIQDDQQIAVDASSCFGTFGTLGTIGGCAGTFGTYGCG